MSDTFQCPVCGEEVEVGRAACPECGACEQTGWGDEESGDLDLPSDDFDYESFVEREFGQKKAKSQRERWIGTIAIILIMIWVFSYIF